MKPASGECVQDLRGSSTVAAHPPCWSFSRTCRRDGSSSDQKCRASRERRAAPERGRPLSWKWISCSVFYLSNTVAASEEMFDEKSLELQPMVTV